MYSFSKIAMNHRYFEIYKMIYRLLHISRIEGATQIENCTFQQIYLVYY